VTPSNARIKVDVRTRGTRAAQVAVVRVPRLVNEFERCSIIIPHSSSPKDKFQFWVERRE